MAKMFEACLAKAVADKKISQKTADDYKKHYDGAAKDAMARGLGDPDVSAGAYNFATSEAAQRMMKQVGQQKAVTAQEIVRLQNLMNFGNDYTVRGKASPYDALTTLFGIRRRGKGEMPSLGEQQRAALSSFQNKLTDVIEALRSKNWGLTRDVAHPWDMVREHYGHDSGNPSAKVNLQSWKEANDWHVDRLEDEKVFVAAREDYILPQLNNSLNVRLATRAGYIASYLDRIGKGDVGLRDWQAADRGFLDINKAPDEARMREILGSMYDSITTHGHAAIEPGMPNDTSLADRYNRRRVVDYLTLDGYKWFQETYGNGINSMGDQFMRDVHRKAVDLGTARTLGGDADKTVKTMMDWGKNRELTPRDINRLDAVYFHSSGKAQEATNVAAANWMGGLRQMFAGNQLHSAVIASLPDFALMRATASWNGLDTSRMQRFYLSGIAGDPRRARQHDIIVETGIRGLRDHFDQNSTANLTNFKNGMTLPEKWEAASAGMNRIAGQSAEFVMRGTGLENHSARGRAAVGMEIQATAADHAGVAFDNLEHNFKRSLERYGITPEDWDILRHDALRGDGLFLSPGQLAWDGTARQRTAANKMLGMIDAEAHYGVAEGNVLTRAFLLGHTKPGDFIGEMGRAIQYKGFSLSVTMMQGARMREALWDKTGQMFRGQYLASLAIEATLLGATSYQLKNIIAGKDPENMFTPQFLVKAAAMGGAGGMWADQVKTLMQTRSADDLTRMVSPTAAFAFNTVQLTTGNLVQLGHDENTNAGREFSNYLKKYLLPRLWFTNRAVDKLGFDTLQRMLDPDAAGAFYRIEQRVRKQDNNQFWDKPGGPFLAPSRAPDLSAAIGGR